MKEQIPKGWSLASLDELTIRISNGANVVQFDENVGHPISRIETIWDGVIDSERVKYIKEDDVQFIEKYKLQDGDILFSHINSDNHIGKTAIYKQSPRVLIHGINLLLIRFSNYLCKDFFNYQFKYMKNYGSFSAVAQRAVNQSSINQQKIKLFTFKIPPLNEQKRIVAKIEELFSELDNGITALKTAREQLKVYRQAILKHAFEGKLTAKWREENPDKLETPEQLLTCIQQERDARYQQQLEEWSAAAKEGKKPIKPRKQKIETGDSTDFANLCSLPAQWKWVLLNEISEHIVDGTHHTPSYTDSGVPFVSAKDIRDFKVDFSDTRYIDTIQHQELIKRCKPRINSVLLTKSGTIGRVALIEEDREFSLFESVANIPLLGGVEGRFVAWSVYFQVDTHFGAKKQKGVAVRHLHLEDIRRLPVPLSSSAEQRAIVQKLEGIFSVIDKNKQAIDNELRRAENLRQSILKKAFTGKLVPQDSSDEPASELLARIKTEKVQQKQPAKNKVTKGSQKKVTSEA